MSKFVYLNKSQSENMRFNTGRLIKYVSIKSIVEWVHNSRTNVHPLPMDKQTIAQNEVYRKLIAYLSTEELE